MKRIAQVGNVTVGTDQSLTLIAGPCVLETEVLTLRIAERLQEMTSGLEVQLVFKASFDKANRTSIESHRGVGLEEGLRILERVKSEHELPVTTDIHESHQAGSVGEVCDLLQIRCGSVQNHWKSFTNYIKAPEKLRKPHTIIRKA